MKVKIIAIAALVLALGGATPAQAATRLTLPGQHVVAGDDLPLLKETWLCGKKLRDGRAPHAWIRRFSFTSGTGAHLEGYDMTRGQAPERVSKHGLVAARCYLRPTLRQLGYA